MSRLVFAGTVVAGLVGASVTARAETQAEIAARYNEEGKALLFENNFSGASAKFAEAVARVPEPKYFINHCTALFQEGEFDRAITACEAAKKNGTPAQVDKSNLLIGKIKEEAKAQGLEVHAGGGGGGPGDTPPIDPNNPNPNPNVGGGDPNNPNPNPGDPNNPNTGNPPPNYQPVVGRPPTVNLFAGTKPDNNYTWTLGIDLYGGGGTIGQEGYYGSATAGIRLKGDYLLNPASRLGAQGYIQVNNWGQGETDMPGAASLSQVDFGAALYKHVCLQGYDRICLTPLLGGHLSMLSPQGEEVINPDGSTTTLFNYASAGVRAEVNLAIAFGQRQEHVLNVALGANAYTGVFSAPAYDMNGQFYGLDKGGAFGYLGVGYTYRFNTPFGTSPFVTLE